MQRGVDLGIDHLTDLQVIGRGGFSVVYSATDAQLRRRVAVKVLEAIETETDRLRFDRECEMLGRLSSHPNITTVYSAGFTPTNQPYLVMELVPNGSVHDLLTGQGPIEWRQAVELTIPVAAALETAHSQGVLHRDIKPENILLDGLEPRLADFGIARFSGASGATSTMIAASWLHSPPETLDNKRDERSDVYSLASTLYTMVVGSAPFWRPDETSITSMMRRVTSDPAPPVPLGLGPPELDRLIQSALAKEPSVRPQTARQFGDALRALTSQAEAGVATPFGTPPPQGFQPNAVVPPPVAPQTFAPPSVGPPPASPVASPTADTIAAAAPDAASLGAPLGALGSLPPPGSAPPVGHQPVAPLGDLGSLPPPGSAPPMGHQPAGSGGPPIEPLTTTSFRPSRTPLYVGAVLCAVFFLAAGALAVNSLRTDDPDGVLRPGGTPGSSSENSIDGGGDEGANEGSNTTDSGDTTPTTDNTTTTVDGVTTTVDGVTTMVDEVTTIVPASIEVVTAIDVSPASELGVSTYSADYNATITRVRRNGSHLLDVSFDALGLANLRQPETSCLRNASTGSVARPVDVNLTTNQAGRFVGTLTFTVLESGSWSFQYSCASDYSLVPVATVNIDGPGLSRFSDEFSALVLGYVRTPTKLSVDFASHGLDNLRDPLTSCVTDGTTTVSPSGSDLAVIQNNYYTGTLVFTVDASTDSYGFTYSCLADYTSVQLD